MLSFFMIFLLRKSSDTVSELKQTRLCPLNKACAWRQLEEGGRFAIFSRSVDHSPNLLNAFLFAFIIPLLKKFSRLFPKTP